MLTIAEALRQFVESDAYENLFSNLRAKYLKEFETSEEEDYNCREQAYVKLRVLRDLDKEIVKHLNAIKLNRSND